MHIDSLSLGNYRCFDKLAIDFDQRLTVLVGPNGSGKTAVLRALVPLLAFAAQKFKEKASPPNAFHSSPDLPFQAYDLPFGGIPRQSRFSIA